MSEQQSAIGGGLALVGIVLTISGWYTLIGGDSTLALFFHVMLLALAIGTFSIHKEHE